MDLIDYSDPNRPPTPAKPSTSTPATPSAFPRWFVAAIAALLVLNALTFGLLAWDHLPQFPRPGPGPTPIHVPVVPEPLRVLFVYESSAPLTREQNNILDSSAIRAYLTGHCLKDGDMPAWRYWDKDVDAAKETTTWQSAWAAAKAEPTPLPKVVIFTKTAMIANPLPADEPATLALLKKYGGP